MGLFFSFLFSINNEYCIIDSIVINGNKNTKDYIIKREIFHITNKSLLDSSILKDDINRLYNLGIFSNVEIEVENNIYKINVVESFHIYPIPLIEYNEIKDQLSFGPALVNTNLFGHHQSLFFGSYISGEKGYILGYNNPWIAGNRINLGLTLLNLKLHNIFYNYRYHYILNKLSSGFSINQIHRYGYSLEYMKININQVLSNNLYYQIINSKAINYEYINLNFNYEFDKRDIYIDPTKGHLFNIGFKYYKGINKTDNILSIFMKLKFFHSVDLYSNPVFSYQIQTINKFPRFNQLPFFAYEYLGGESFVRGYSSLPNEAPEEVSRLIENSNIIYCSFELQNTLIQRKDFGKIEFGLDGIVFFDIGTSSNFYNSFNLNDNIMGYGVGFKVFISSIAPITVLFGLNPYGQQHYHIMDS